MMLEPILHSLCCVDGLNTIDNLLSWILLLNNDTYVRINESSLNDDDFWYYDVEKGEVTNRKNSFFSIKGIKSTDNGTIQEQPIIIQPEIGYLGLIGKFFNGVLHFLMQAKIEPGNINCVQISPTIQATKSNFTQKHGGSKPAYLDYFVNSNKYNVIYDQIQSEQSSRFYKKRNRNMIMIVNDDVDVLPNFKWMTLGQIKKMMETDNLVNMDTRTVLSGLPLIGIYNNCDNNKYEKYFNDKTLFNSIFNVNPVQELPLIYQKINNFKMFSEKQSELVPLNELNSWTVNPKGIECLGDSPFVVRYYDIEIAGREVRKWTQPLFKATGQACFGLITKNFNGTKKFLVKIKSEIGSFDYVELGPSIQWEATHSMKDDDNVERLFRESISNTQNVLIDVILSEEGGRFYHEQNRNIIINIDSDIEHIPNEYIWVSYSTLCYLVQINNCLNIQLRNLLSLLDL